MDGRKTGKDFCNNLFTMRKPAFDVLLIPVCCISLLLILTGIYFARITARRESTYKGYVNPLWHRIPHEMYSCLQDIGKNVGGYTCDRWCCIKHNRCNLALISTHSCTSEEIAYSFTTLHRSINCNRLNDTCSHSACQCDIEFFQCVIDCIDNN